MRSTQLWSSSNFDQSPKKKAKTWGGGYSTYSCKIGDQGVNGPITKENCMMQYDSFHKDMSRCKLTKSNVCRKRQNRSPKRAKKNWDKLRIVKNQGKFSKSTSSKSDTANPSHSLDMPAYHKSIPLTAKIEIMMNLSASDIMKYCSLDSEMASFCDEDENWKKLAKHKFGVFDLGRQNTWMELYINLLKYPNLMKWENINWETIEPKDEGIVLAISKSKLNFDVHMFNQIAFEIKDILATFLFIIRLKRNLSEQFPRNSISYFKKASQKEKDEVYSMLHPLV